MKPTGHHWQVVVATLHNKGDATDGAQETVLTNGPEDEARNVYADTVATAEEKHYEYIRLRHEGRDVDWWPPATGWTS